MVRGKARLFGVAMAFSLMGLGVAAQPSWAEDAFAKITGSIQGAILGDQGALPGIPSAKDTVQIFSTAFGLTVAQSQVGGGGAATGKVNASPVALVKHFDRASPKLLRAAFTGESLTIEITWFMIFQGLPQKTVTIRLEGAVITDIQAGADLHGTVASDAESVSVTYTRLIFSTPIIDPVTHKVTGTSSVCLDAVNNKIC
jgi:type VI secretion system Hcp family effector